MTIIAGRLRHVGFVLAIAVLPLVVDGAAATPPQPRFPGGASTVAVNRADGRVAVLQGATLSVYPAIKADAPSASFEIPGKDPAVLEFRGNQVTYTTHGVNNMPVVFVAVSVEGRERLAWPNAGISDLFPTETSRLTLDGKGVYGFLPFDPPARAFFGLANEIPLGAGVAATYRFAGEKLLARGSEAFVAVVALSTDDMVLALRGGGLMRYRSPGGVAWKREGTGGDWRIADVDPSAGLVVTIDAQGAAVGTDLEKGEPRWRCGLGGSKVRDARLLHGDRLLLLVTSPNRHVAVLDPATGKPSGPQPADLCERQGLSEAFGGWLADAVTLDGFLEVPGGDGVAWLLHGPDGWYPVQVPR
jgi:hypothetical protein